jgi:hypothetical protein
MSPAVEAARSRHLEAAVGARILRRAAVVVAAVVSNRLQEEEEEEEADCPQGEAEAAANQTSRSSYAALGAAAPSSKLRMIQA